MIFPSNKNQALISSIRYSHLGSIRIKYPHYPYEKVKQGKKGWWKWSLKFFLIGKKYLFFSKIRDLWLQPKKISRDWSHCQVFIALILKKTKMTHFFFQKWGKLNENLELWNPFRKKLKRFPSNYFWKKFWWVSVWQTFYIKKKFFWIFYES